MRETSLGRARSLWMRAKPRSRRSAIDVALCGASSVPVSQLLARPDLARKQASKQADVALWGSWEKNLPLRAPRIRTNDHAPPDIQILANPPQRAGFGIQIIDGHVEEALDLTGMQIHGNHMIAARRLQHVGHQFRRDGGARLVLFVLARVGEVRDHGGDAPRRRRFARVDHDQQLH